jgi:signal transduction histidine kinase/CheY-like chemotaxis protein
MTNAFFKSKQGEMFFGTNNGLVRFFPEKILENLYKPNIVISELSVGNKRIMPGDRVNRRIILEQPIQKTTSITLDHKTRIFSLKFNALHYANPEKNSYKYKLDPIDTDWKYANAYNNTVTYTSLPKGKYTFTVYAANNDRIYCDNPVELSIRVLPPFWQTWSFRVIFTLLLISLVLWAFRRRLRKVQLQKKMLEKVVMERTAELNQSYSELKDQKTEILAQNVKIQAQNEEMLMQREFIERNNALLEEANKNLKLINEFGGQLTATLDKSSIDRLIHQYVRSYLNFNIFGLGIYDHEKNGITFTDFTEEGIKVSDFTSTMDDTSSMGICCFKRNKTIVCNDFENEYINYISHLNIRSARIPQSVIYVPLVIGTKKIGIFTLQSYTKNAFPDQVIPLVESMASYIAIALDNAKVYEIVSEQNVRLEKKKEFLEYLVKERTRDLERAKNKAEESDKLKSAFLSNMSHEIRTPLNAIIGFIELLNAGDNTPEETASFYHIIKNSGFTLLQLINDIIDFSKMESGQLEFFITDVNVNELLSDIYKTFSEEIRKNHQPERSLELKLTMPSENKIILRTDTVRLQQIFNNLVGNAIKFTPEGTIEFGIKDIIPGREILFFVRDTGIGIEKKYQQLIFNRFIKIDNNKSTLYRGTGLGLAITKHLAETMGGMVQVESEPGKGSEFTFSLPYESTPDNVKPPVRKTSLKDEIIPNWSDKHFLIVEDEKSNYLMINSLLQKTKAKTTWAQNGEEGVNMYRQQKDSISLVLLDIKLPRMNGFQVIKILKELNPAVIVIAQTAYALANEEHMIYQAGFDGYLVKPITLNSLVQIISKFI